VRPSHLGVDLRLLVYSCNGRIHRVTASDGAGGTSPASLPARAETRLVDQDSGDAGSRPDVSGPRVGSLLLPWQERDMIVTSGGAGGTRTHDPGMTVHRPRVGLSAPGGVRQCGVAIFKIHF